MRRYGFLFFIAGAALASWSPAALPASEINDQGFALENGDVNADGDRDISDPIYLLAYLFLGGPKPLPLAYCAGERPAVSNGDTNLDGGLDVSDVGRLVNWLFLGSVEPAAACTSSTGDGAGAGAGGGNVPRIAPPDSNAYGNSLAGWLETYWRWILGTGADPAQSMVGRVKLLPIPAAQYISGDGTPASPAILQGFIEVHLKPGTPFVIPQFAWTAERYDPSLGLPDDPTLDDDVLLAGVSPNMTLDGKTIVSDANESDFYVPATAFDPIVTYPVPSSYGSVAALAFQGTGIVSAPLPPGEHELKLYEPYIIDGHKGFSFGVIYDNTWKIIVKP